MFTDRVLRRLREKVLRREETILGEMARGSAKDFSEYKLYVGRLRGLAELNELINEVAKEMEVEANE